MQVRLIHWAAVLLYCRLILEIHEGEEEAFVQALEEAFWTLPSPSDILMIFILLESHVWIMHHSQLWSPPKYITSSPNALCFDTCCWGLYHPKNIGPAKRCDRLGHFSVNYSRLLEALQTIADHVSTFPCR